MTASEIRALFAVASRPEVVSLAGGMPNISGLPARRRRRRDRRPDRRTTAPTALQYGSGQGDPRAARADQRRDAARGHRGPPRRRRRHRRLPAGGRPGHPDLLRPRRRGALRGPVVRRRARRLQVLPVRRRARRDGRRRAGARGARQAIAAVKAAGKTIKFLYTIPNFHNPAGVTLSAPAARRDPGDLPRRRHPGARGQPLRPAGLRRRADARPARRRGRGRDLPRLVLQDLRPRLPGRLGAGPARRTREAGARPGVGDAVPAVVQPDGGLGVPRPARLAGPDQAVPRDVPRAPRRDGRRARRPACRPPAPGTCRPAASTSG